LVLAAHPPATLEIFNFKHQDRFYGLEAIAPVSMLLDLTGQNAPVGKYAVCVSNLEQGCSRSSESRICTAEVFDFPDIQRGKA
jgi:hypothetical protein